jgi:hypothetical protein
MVFGGRVARRTAATGVRQGGAYRRAALHLFGAAD